MLNDTGCRCLLRKVQDIAISYAHTRKQRQQGSRFFRRQRPAIALAEFDDPG
jgi:hypothetical protein